MRRSAAAALILWLCACPDRDGPREDRALAILRAERDRQSGKLPAAPPNEALAQAAAAQDASEHALPTHPPATTLGPFSVQVTAAAASQGVGNAKVHLTTTSRFLKVSLAVRNTAASLSPADFGFASVAWPADTAALARDATRLSGTAALAAPFAPGESREVVLYFEVPPQALAPGLALLLPAGIAGDRDVRILLE